MGLFAIPVSRVAIAAAKIVACLGWGTVLAVAQGTISTLGGLALGLPLAGAFRCWLVLSMVGVATVLSAVPVAWVASHCRGYLPGIGATLAVVVVTNLVSGFGLGGWLPWSIPVLWATPGSGVPGRRC